jgi:uroporphyrinogen-III synthase
MAEGTHKPRSALRVALTRETADNAWLAQQLAAAGASVDQCPLVKVQLVDPAGVTIALARYDWLAATSRRALAWLDWRRGVKGAGGGPGFDRAACVGEATAQYARAVLKLEPLVAQPHTAAALARAMKVAAGSTVFFPRGNLAREELAGLLRQSGARVDDPVVYETRADADGAAKLKALLQQQALDAVVLASPSAVEFALQAGVPLGAVACFSIGPSTTDALQAAGIVPARQAQPHTAQGLLDALLQWKAA